MAKRRGLSNTKFLFNEEDTPKGMVSVSQLQTYLSCKRKWQYNYIENLKPRVERSYLTIGKLCHGAMHAAMLYMWKNNGWNSALSLGVEVIKTSWQEFFDETSLLPEEVPNFEQMLEDAISVFRQAFEEFEPWRYEVLSVVKDGRYHPALELHFRVPCKPTRGLHGYIDAILRDKETGFIWCTDYKFRKSLAPDEDEAFNIQNAVYSYACMKMGIDITGTMTWQHLNTPAADPKINKDGSISTAKIKTTWNHYAKFCEDHGQDPQDYYTDMVSKLGEIEWFRVTHEYRNEETIQRIWDECVMPVAKCVKSAHGKNANNFRSLYPWNCVHGCPYQQLCQAELRNYDANSIREREYTRR